MFHGFFVKLALPPVFELSVIIIIIIIITITIKTDRHSEIVLCTSV